MSRTVGDLMVAAVISAGPDETLGEVAQKMSQHDISAVPVVDPNGVLVGIVTSEDLVDNYEVAIPVSRVMTAPVQTLTPSTDVREAARRMREQRHHHVVVLEDDRVVGILSTFDLLGLVQAHG